MNKTGEYTATWVYLGCATLGFFCGAAVYNIQPVFIPGEAAVYASIGGASMFLLVAIPKIHTLFDSVNINVTRIEGVGMMGCVISTLGFALLASTNGQTAADIALGGFYLIAVWILTVNVYGLRHAPWPKAISFAGMAAAPTLVIVAFGNHTGESDIMSAGAVLSMGLVPLWLAGLTSWLIFHDMRLRAMANVENDITT